ncbi:hypothetical protein T4B_4909 [Trichinella pseudospiralis]|uniref:Uncharacterized protein n=1 Tax=Trichinella pseudospiralis TaxID=6337 RepID=A0A0V1DSS7_TRIPS|nr:hypothetical protein T4A_527 [Trichinella pseudospiralis]KRY64478.1 hypothetical protein T4A_5724 [Trichinella pseudospiralis]KRZ03589.1 hypothetical protein T4B_4909 [Trichinella pseudospiralis]KRZ25767.1 hypothetical protein T4C_7348 [Trichinella pseudospiralis]
MINKAVLKKNDIFIIVLGLPLNAQKTTKLIRSMYQILVVFVVKCLENVLKSATAGSWPELKVHIPFVKNFYDYFGEI